MNQEEKQMTTNPSGFLLFIFAMQVFLYWGIYQGIFAKDTYLIYGLLCLACFPIYIIGGLFLSKRNEDFMANLYIIFGTLFGGIMGLIYIVYFLDGVHGWGLEPTFLGIPFLLGGIVLIPTMIPYRFAPWFEFVTWLIVTIWLITCGVEYFTGGYFLYQVNKWLALIVGICITYLCMHELLRLVGSKGLPMGKSFFKFPNNDEVQ